MADSKSKNITAVSGNGKVILTWDEVDGATGYIIKNGDDTVQYTEISTTANTYTITGLTNGTEYTFKIYTYINSKWYESYTIVQTPLPYPQNVKAVVGTGKVTLTWDEVADSDGYIVKSADGEIQYTPKTITTTSYTITGLANGTEYSFKVYSYSADEDVGEATTWYSSAAISATPFVEDCFIVRRGKTYTSYTMSDDGYFQYPSKVVIPSNVTLLPNSVRGFTNHNEIVEVSLESNSSLYTLAQYAFQNCMSLKKIDLSNVASSTIRFITGAFHNCQALEEIIFNDETQITESSESCFYNCYALTNECANEILARFYSTIISSCGTYFYNCTSLTNIKIPEGVTSIQGSANMFYGCTNLEEFTFPSTLQKFYNCNLFFGSCSSLKKVIFKSVIDSSSAAVSVSGGYNMFAACTALETIEIPEEWNVSLYISNGSTSFSNVITHDCMVNIFNDLATVDSGTITLGETNLARLSDEEKAIATDKGWTLA